MSFATHLQCSRCGASYPIDELINVCRCGAGVLAQYDLQAAKRVLDRDKVASSGRSIWKYRDLLPVFDPDNAITLGEGGTPLLPVPRLGERLSVKNIFLKDEGINPTGTFKARGASVGASKARELGARDLILPSSGNAAYAWATYAAKGGMTMHLVFPGDAREINLKGSALVGADMYLVDGDRGDAGRIAQSAAERYGWFDVSKEPYRTEGKKTIGYEIAEQLGWRTPDVLLFPTGGGAGLAGISKAFREMAELGWIEGRMPRFVVVQSEGCWPVVRAYREGRPVETWQNPYGIANGIRNPTPLWGDVIVSAVKESDGTGVVVTDEEILESVKLLAATESILGCPEGCATVAGAARLKESGFIGPDDVVVLVNTGSGLKYPQLFEQPRVPRLKPGDDIVK